MTEVDILKDKIIQFLEDHKALDSKVLDLEGKTALAKYMIVASGTSQRHVSSMAGLLQEYLHQQGIKNVPVEGLEESHWVLLDGGDIIIHLFRPEVRLFYNLEKLWGD